MINCLLWGLPVLVTLRKLLSHVLVQLITWNFTKSFVVLFHISPHVTLPGLPPSPPFISKLIVVFLFCYVFNQVRDVHGSTTEVLISRYVATMFSFGSAQQGCLSLIWLPICSLLGKSQLYDLIHVPLCMQCHYYPFTTSDIISMPQAL